VAQKRGDIPLRDSDEKGRCLRKGPRDFETKKKREKNTVLDQKHRKQAREKDLLERRRLLGWGGNRSFLERKAVERGGREETVYRYNSEGFTRRSRPLEETGISPQWRPPLYLLPPIPEPEESILQPIKVLYLGIK